MMKQVEGQAGHLLMLLNKRPLENVVMIWSCNFIVIFKLYILNILKFRSLLIRTTPAGNNGYFTVHGLQ